MVRLAEVMATGAARRPRGRRGWPSQGAVRQSVGLLVLVVNDGPASTTSYGSPSEIILSYGQGKSVVEYLIATYDEAQMVELIRGMKRTFDIDKALESAYGVDQYGLDSEWRRSLGVEPLPRPEARQPRVTATPTPTDAPPPTPVAPTATPVPTVEPNLSPDSTPNSTPDGNGESPVAAPGCGAATQRAGMVADLAMLSLLGGPMGILGLRIWRSRWRDRGQEKSPL